MLNWRAIKSFVNSKYEEAEVYFSYLTTQYPSRFEGYEGLIILAQKTQQKTLLETRLNEAIKRFPQHLLTDSPNLLISLWYIQSLIEKGDIFQAEQFIQKQSPLFREQPDWALVEATFWAKQYKYEEAQSILDVSAEKYPEHLKLRSLQAYNAWAKGDLSKAKTILEYILPRLNFKREFLPTNFTLPYIDTLLSYNIAPST